MYGWFSFYENLHYLFALTFYLLLLNMGEFPSGQRGQTVNLLLIASVVRIHPLPPEKTVGFDRIYRLFNEINPVGFVKYPSGVKYCNAMWNTPCGVWIYFISLETVVSNFTIYEVNYFTLSKARYFTKDINLQRNLINRISLLFSFSKKGL